MFLPAHSVVIELFPRKIYSRVILNMAEMLDLHYFPVFSVVAPGLTEAEARAAEPPADLPPPMRTQAYWDECGRANASSSDHNAYAVCREAARAAPAVVPAERLRDVIRDAIDSIGAYSLMNPEWKELSVTQGQPLPPKPIPNEQDKYGING
jgi:hypothetical protein